ncbi:aminodeoxychorismate synthase component I [Vibrio maerlii]|uniref:aminodeoxychorismate synthase component I n=1 Tax=Vibrio maerlii TaxID=2231648 RepID=UPI000E3D0FAB|nr:aminodeoxychorismate synthase component I [Vibrio maerlii]
MNNKQPTALSYIPLNYEPTLAYSLFEPIEALPWAMLLCSSSNEHVDSRFDILVANPLATVTTKGTDTTTSVYRFEQDSPFERTLEEKVTHQGDPFTTIESVMDEQLAEIDTSKYVLPQDCPFVGGILGYFSYDLGRHVETLPNLAKHDIDNQDMAVGLYETAVIIDHQDKAAYCIGLYPKEFMLWLHNQKKKPQLNFGLTSDWTSNMSKQEYSQRFDQVQEYLLSGDCYQINLAQRFNVSYQGSEWDAFNRLNEQNKAPFSAFIRTEESSIISISPERFLLLDKHEIETKPIKGTRPRFSDPALDENSANELKAAEKDQAENLMIVDLLRNDIGRVAKPGTVHVPKLFDIESFPAVHHLVSTIRAKLDDEYNATDLLRACFPGGSITGAPKVRAMQIIEELEPHRRSTYCGSIGYISRCGRMDTSITIRTLVAHNNQLFAWAGGGVVADSQCDAEYQETFDKLSRILPILEKKES